MSRPASPLARFAHLGQEPDPAKAWDACAEAWHRDGIVCVNPDELERRKGWLIARAARNVGEIAFGKRKA